MQGHGWRLEPVPASAHRKAIPVPASVPRGVGRHVLAARWRRWRWTGPVAGLPRPLLPVAARSMQRQARAAGSRHSIGLLPEPARGPPRRARARAAAGWAGSWPKVAAAPEPQPAAGLMPAIAPVPVAAPARPSRKVVLVTVSAMPAAAGAEAPGIVLEIRTKPPAIPSCRAARPDRSAASGRTRRSCASRGR